MRKVEEDFPPGHPGRADYNPASPEAIEWERINVHPLGERDFPVDHPGAIDTPGNRNTMQWAAGVDPFNPHREAHTGRTPAQAEGVRRMSERATERAKESPVMQPIDAIALSEAMDAKRKEVGRDVLTEDEHRQVLAEFHRAPKPEGE